MEVIAAAAIGALATIIVAVIGGVFSSKLGLPGLGREVQGQQAALISTLQAELGELRAQRSEDARRLGELEECGRELTNVRRRLLLAEADLVDLYRQTGTTPPRHLRQRARDEEG
mgnify:CR=1 FL=1